MSFRILLLFTAIAAVVSSKSLAQQADNDERLNCDYEACNCLFLELGGNGIGASLNFEKLISQRVGVRGGVGSVPFVGTTIPVCFSWYSGIERKLELGGGVVFLPVWEEWRQVGRTGTILLSSTIAGKFQPQYGGFMIRFAVTPFYSLTTNTFFFFGGISFGHAF